MHQDEEFTVHKFEPGDEDKYVELHASVFGARSTAEFWRWKYYENPYHENYIYVALADGKFVGQVGGMPFIGLLNGKKVKYSQSLDIMIEEEYRKGGVFYKLEAAARQDVLDHGCKLTYGFAPRLTHVIATRKLGYRDNSVISNIIKFYDPTPFLKKALGVPVLPALLGKLLKPYLSLRNRVKNVPKNVTVREVAEITDDFTKIFEETIDQKFAVYRSAEHLKWRYQMCPTVTYKILGAYEEGLLVGYAVISISKKRTLNGNISELLALRWRRDVVRALLKAIDIRFKNEKVNIANAWVPKHIPLYETMRAGGYVDRKMQHHFHVRSCGPEAPDELIEVPENWFYSFGDSDYALLETEEF